MTIHEKLHQIQNKVGRVNKSGTNTFSKYDYCTLADMLEPIKPLLEEYKVTITQSIIYINSEFIKMDNAYYTSASVQCSTTITDVETNEFISVETPGYSCDKNSDKAIYKAITGSRKYGVSAMFALEWFSVEPEDDKFDDKRFNEPAPTKTAKTFKRSF